MVNPDNLILWITLGIDLRVEYLNDIGGRKRTRPRLLIPVSINFTLVLLLVEGSLDPVLDLVWIRVTKPPNILQHL